jgi:4-diphosphocytidyl-2-C-methyl-D-erythritol kinase
VLTPQVSVPTQEIFKDPGLTRDTKPVKIAVFFADDGSGAFHNDLEPVAVRKYPAVGRALAWLADAGWRGRMSGSGASVFAVFGNEADARRAAEQAPRDVRAFVAKGLDEHPLN